MRTTTRLPVGIGIHRAPQPYSLASPRIGLNDAGRQLGVINLVGPLRRQPHPAAIARSARSVRS